MGSKRSSFPGAMDLTLSIHPHFPLLPCPHASTSSTTKPANPLKTPSQCIALTAFLPGRLQCLGCWHRRYPRCLISHAAFSPLCDSSTRCHVSIRGGTSPATHQMLRHWCTLTSGARSASSRLMLICEAATNPFASWSPSPSRTSRGDFCQLTEKEKCRVRGSCALLMSREEAVWAVRSWEAAFHGQPSVVLTSYI